MAESQTEKLFKLNLSLDQWLIESKEMVRQIEQKNSPRQLFNSWKNSQEGKLWKRQQYIKQQGECAICQHTMPLKGSHIDHIKPIANHPDLALDLNNLRLACSHCNLSKGIKT
jgi:5-methylcytosine-specific restriction endonuclease McrA